ncbi:hypothetical protein ACW0S0_09360 [Fusobacterium polymorphum]
MEKENVLEIEYQEVFDEVAVRIKNINNDFLQMVFIKKMLENIIVVGKKAHTIVKNVYCF